MCNLNLYVGEGLLKIMRVTLYCLDKCKYEKMERPNCCVVLIIFIYFRCGWLLQSSTMFDKFKDFFSTILDSDTLNIENALCRLHNRATPIILLTFSIVLSLEQYIGDPIGNCTTHAI